MPQCSDTVVRMAKPRPKTYKLSDSAGLYLEVAPTGLAILALEVLFQPCPLIVPKRVAVHR